MAKLKEMRRFDSLEVLLVYHWRVWVSLESLADGRATIGENC